MTERLHTAPLVGATLAPPGSDLTLSEVVDPGGGSDPPDFIAPAPHP